mgnify:CR=1 FL=1
MKEIKLKFIFLGDAGVGKTSIVRRHIPNMYSDTYTSTIGVDYIHYYRDKPNYLLIARMHPLYMDPNICRKFLGETNKYYENKLLSKYSKKLIFINPEVIPFGSKSNEVFYPLKDIEILKELYCSAHLLLTEYSTTLLEGFIFDLPVINVAIGNYRNTNLPIRFIGNHHHLWRLKKYNVITECENYKDLKLIINNIVNGEDKTIVFRREFVKAEININPGNASKKIIDEILNISVT